MLQTLLISALLMGLAGTPHCLAMCGSACAAMAPARKVPWAFFAARLASYSAAGAVAAASVGALSQWSSAVAALRPLWTLVHMAALVLGVYLLWRGRQPAWMERLGAVRAPDVATVSLPAGRGWRRLAAPGRRIALGALWVAWPCGLLQSALLVAALANDAAGGAAVMAAFALASAAGLALGPALWWRLVAGLGGAAGGASAQAAWVQRLSTWPVRLAGLSLAAASVWALGHGVWLQVAAWCGL